jgi:hypothetical protein
MQHSNEITLEEGYLIAEKKSNAGEMQGAGWVRCLLFYAIGYKTSEKSGRGGFVTSRRDMPV